MRGLLLLAALAMTTGAFANDVCIVPSPNGINGTVDCDQPTPNLWPNSHTRGFSLAGALCETGGFCGFEPGAPENGGEERPRGFNDYGWTISASNIDPYVNTWPGPPPVPGTLLDLWLWYECSLSDGMTAAEFTIETSHPGLIHLATTTQQGFLNAGSLTDVLLAVGGCPVAPISAAHLLFLYLGPVAVEDETWGGIKALYR